VCGVPGLQYGADVAATAPTGLLAGALRRRLASVLARRCWHGKLGDRPVGRTVSHSELDFGAGRGFAGQNRR